MKGLFYSWLMSQVLIGIWLFVSPFILGVSEFNIVTNNMIIGAIVVILGVGMAFYEFYHKERIERGAFIEKLFFPWIGLQLLIGVWLFIAPFLLGFEDSHMAVNNMLFGSVVIVLGVGTFFFELYHKEEFETMQHVKERS